MKVLTALMIFGSFAQFCCAVPAKCEQEKCLKGCEIVNSLDAKLCPDCDCTNLNKKKDDSYVCDEPKCPTSCVSQLVHTGPCPECKCKDETKEKGSQYLSRSKREETEIDECKNYPCSQHCHNTNGSFKCSCEEGYLSTNDGITCKANSSVTPMLIYTNAFNIFQMGLHGRNSNLMVSNLNGSWGLAFDWKENCTYFTENGKIFSIRRVCSDSPEPQVVQSGFLQSCEALAVDWIGNNLYWTDAGTLTIEVSTLDGKFRKILIKKRLKKPRAIVLDPFRGYMYWTDWGHEPYIGKAGMDGTKFSKLITESLVWPNGLAIDYVTKEIFWADGKENCIAVSDLDGRNMRTIIKKGQFAKAPRYYSLAVFEDQLYWSNWKTNSIERCHKYHCDNYSTIATTNYRPLAIQVVHPYMQALLQTANPCTTSGCQFLCLLKPGGDATCSCPENHVLEADKVSCRSNCTISQFLCKSTYKCIPRKWYCDTNDDCGDKSDEPAGCQPLRCKAEEFLCDNYACIPTQEICDGYSQCGDMSDEQNCGPARSPEEDLLNEIFKLHFNK